jgi:mannose-6-phosphate isomerase-like protein (cupin superfamily)
MKMIYFSIGLFLFVVFGAAAQSDSLQNIKPTAYSIDKCVNSFSMDDAEVTKVGYQYWFANKDFIDGRTIKLSVVNPHEASHPPHSHANDEFFFIIEGTAEFFLAGETRIVKPYTSLYCPSNVEHGIKNIGDVELKYLVIKTYPVDK